MAAVDVVACKGQTFLTPACFVLGARRDDFLTVIQALGDAEPGKVLVVDGGGGTRALVGELFATEAAW